MDVTVVYEGGLNNTRSIAEAILAGAQDVHPCIRVHVESTSTLPRDGVVRPDLLIVGSPADALRMSASAPRHHGTKPGTRRVSIPTTAGVDRPGARDWLHALGRAKEGSSAAAFDTHLTFPFSGGRASLSGATTRPTTRWLRRQGYQLVAHPESFAVDAAYGFPGPGEEARARAWGSVLVRRAVYERALHKANPVLACHRGQPAPEGGERPCLFWAVSRWD